VRDEDVEAAPCFLQKLGTSDRKVDDIVQDFYNLCSGPCESQILASIRYFYR
jgi:hypothetical protein